MFVVVRMKFTEGKMQKERLKEFRTLEEAEAFMLEEKQKSTDPDVSFTVWME